MYIRYDEPVSLPHAEHVLCQDRKKLARDANDGGLDFSGGNNRADRRPLDCECRAGGAVERPAWTRAISLRVVAARPLYATEPAARAAHSLGVSRTKFVACEAARQANPGLLKDSIGGFA